MKIPNPAPTIALTVSLLILNIASAIQTNYGAGLPRQLTILHYYVAVPWAIAWWVMADSRRLSIPRPFHYEWIIFSSWPIVLPYYLFRTRGWKALITVLGFAGLFLGCYLLSLIVSFGLFLVSDNE